MGLVVGWPRRRMGQQMVGEVGARGLSLFGGQTLQLWRRSLDAWRVRLFYQKSIYLSIYLPLLANLGLVPRRGARDEDSYVGSNSGGFGTPARSSAWRPYVHSDAPATGQAPPGNGRLRVVPAPHANRHRDRPSACGELQTTAKLRPVDRVSGGQLVRSLRHSRVHTESRARGTRQASSERVNLPPGADWAPHTAWPPAARQLPRGQRRWRHRTGRLR